MAKKFEVEDGGVAATMTSKVVPLPCAHRFWSFLHFGVAEKVQAHRDSGNATSISIFSLV